MSRPTEVPRGAARARRRLALESGRPIAHVADDLGIHKETLRKRVRQAEADQGLRPDLPTSEEREEIKQAAAGELRAAPRERDLEGRERVFRQGARPGPTEVSAFIDEHRDRFGVEPICETLGVSASAYYQRRLASGRPARSRTSGCSSGSARCTGQLLRLRLPADVEGAAACRRAGRPRCQVQRLMRSNGIAGRQAARQAVADHDARPAGALGRPDLVQRDFTAAGPERAVGRRLHLPALLGGLVFFAFVIDVYSRDDRRLAARRPHAHRPRPRRAADGARICASRAPTSS